MSRRKGPGRPSRAQRHRGAEAITTVFGRSILRLRRPGQLLDRTLQRRLAPGTRLEGRDGSDLAALVAADIEEELGRVLAPREVGRTLLLARQLSPRLWVQAMSEGSDVMEASRNTLELAILKWGSHTKPTNLGRGVAQASQPEIESLATVFTLTEAFGNLMALRRRLGKGQPILVTATAPFEYEPDRGELDDLIATYDRRTGEVDNNLHWYGAYQPVDESSLRRPTILFARWVSPEDYVLGGAHEGKEHTSSGRLVRTDLRISRYGFMSDLAETRARVGPLATPPSTPADQPCRTAPAVHATARTPTDTSTDRSGFGQPGAAISAGELAATQLNPTPFLRGSTPNGARPGPGERVSASADGPDTAVFSPAAPRRATTLHWSGLVAFNGCDRPLGAPGSPLGSLGQPSTDDPRSLPLNDHRRRTA